MKVALLRPMKPVGQYGATESISGWCVLQRNLRYRAADLGQVAMSVYFEGQPIESFVTPSTQDGDGYWANGLDDKEWVHECIALYQSEDEALASNSGWCKSSIESATLYKIAFADEGLVLQPITFMDRWFPSIKLDLTSGL